MITLNLIPTEKKKTIQLTQIFLILKNIALVLLLIIAIVAIILLAGKVIIDNQFSRIVEETSLTNRYANLFNVEIKEFNTLVQAVDKIESSYIPWNNFFFEFTNLVPTNVQIYSFELNQGKLLLTGLADSRESLLNFKSNLEKNSAFSNIKVPMDNILKKDNIKFSIISDINLNKLK